MFIEQLGYNLLFRRFVCLSLDNPVWRTTSFTKNRDWLLDEELMAKFLKLLLATREVKPLLSSEHFSVEGLLRAWASHSSLELIDGLVDGPPPPFGRNGFSSSATSGKKLAKGNFRGLLLSNQTDRSTAIETPGCSKRLLVLGLPELPGTLRHGERQWPGGGQHSQSEHRQS